MAKKLNKSRIRDTWIVVVLSLVILLTTKNHNPLSNYSLHEVVEFIGYFLVMFCAFGRVYCSAYLGGYKNNTVVNTGPFSIVRNPLYLFSLIGVLGISFITSNLYVMLFAPTAIYLIYLSLIKREEEYLLATFGDEYKKYIQKTPRFFPNIKNYNAPDTYQFHTKNLNKALFDAVWWFVPFVVLEVLEVFSLV